MLEVSLSYVDLLQKLISATVVCLTPAVAWATLRYSRIDRMEDRRNRQMERVRALEWEVGHVGLWSRRTYDESSHDPSWYNASFQVGEPTAPKLREFNQTVSTEDYGAAVAESLAELEESIDQLNRMVVMNRDAIAAMDLRDPHRRSRLSNCFSHQRELFETPVLLADVMNALQGVSHEDRLELPVIYERNKRLHIDAIGGPGEKGKLYESVNTARTALSDLRERLRTKREPVPFRAANIVAIGLFIVGLVFLLAFGLAAARVLVPISGQSPARP